MAELIKADGTVTVVTPANGKHFTLEELHGFVGGYIEIVDTPPWDGSRLAVCNEDGKRDTPTLNKLATLKAERHRWNDYAAGDWLFADRAELQDDEDDEEDDMDPDDEFDEDEEEDEDLLV